VEEGQTGYTCNAGLWELRQEVARHLEKLYGVTYDPETEVLITVGVSEALYLALVAIVNPGDEVIVPEPCFVAYKAGVILAGGVLVAIVNPGDEVIVPEPCFVAYKAGVILAGGVPVTVPAKPENDFQVTADQIEAAITERTKALLILRSRDRGAHHRRCLGGFVSGSGGHRQPRR